MALISDVHALRGYLKLICEYELHSLRNKNVSGIKDHGKTTSRSDRPWSAIFCVIVYFDQTREFKTNFIGCSSRGGQKSDSDFLVPA